MMKESLSRLVARLRREPVLLTQGAALAVSGAAAWGLELSKEQSVWVGAVAVFVAAVIGRSQVTPTVSVAAEQTEPVTIPGTTLPTYSGHDAPIEGR